MNTELIDFFNITLRFTHVVAAVMWIGNSLLFTWMELNLLKRDGDKDLIGYMDMLHAGGVFHLQKRVLRPDSIPTPLHWFYWQSYTTWLSGFALLITYFFTRADTLMIDPAKTDMGSGGAILISLAGIFGGWALYDLYWRSPLKNYLKIGALVWISLVVLYAWGLNHVFNGRAMFLQVGMTLGSFMTANVFFHIIPNQRRFMKALREGKEHNLKVGKAAKFRSASNHYITFPVIFLMLSGHFSVLYGTEQRVLILFVIIFSLIVIKHMMNVRNHFKPWLAILFGTFAAATAVIIFAIKTPAAASGESGDVTPPTEQEIAGETAYKQFGCNACHQSMDTSTAPGLSKLMGKSRDLADGSSVVIDEAYLKHSILQAPSQVVKGYPAAMPVYQNIITEEQADALVAYLKTL